MAGYSSIIIKTVLVLSLISLCYCGVPVLIWESSVISEKEDVVPAMMQLDTDEFFNHIVKKVHVKKPLIVMFLEENLSVEDFSWTDDMGRGSFPQLQNISSMSAKIEFIPSVEDPVESLKQLTTSDDYLWKKYDETALPTKPGVVLAVKLNDPLVTEDRPDMLRRHDGNIAQIYSELLAKHSHIVAIFTGKQSSWVEPEMNRVRREAEEELNNSTEFMYNADNVALIFSTSYPTLTDNGETLPLKSFVPVKPDIRDNLLRITVSHQVGPKKVVLRYRFEKQPGAWQLREVEYDTGSGEKLMLKANQDISGKMNNSFTSKGPVEFSNGPVKLTFKDLKVQPWAYNSEFSQEENKDQFFTAPIWSGLFVTFILSLILIWGITMLMDIRTMDRFDDPKGKTISVNAAD